MILARAGFSNKSILVLKYRQHLFAQKCCVSTAVIDPFKMVALKSIPKDELGHPILQKKERCGVKTTTDVMGFGIKCAKVILPILSHSLFSVLFIGEFDGGDSSNSAFNCFA
jgi:hypothetical protein